MQLLSPHEYIRQATAAITKAKRRVSFISMIVTEDDSTTALIDALASAARRGVDVQVAGDMFTYAELSGQFIPAHYYSKKVRSSTRMARTLSDAGVRFYWLGRLNVTTVSGRTHSKWCVVDDTVFSFGGVNLYEVAIANTDYMFRLEDQVLADSLCSEQQRIIKSDRNRSAYRSRTLSLGDTGTVLFDAGLFGDSIIYRRVCELTQKARKVTYVSQYCPTGKLSKYLKRTESTLYFNSWQTADSFNRFVIRTGMLITHHTTLYARPAYLHAKCMLFEMSDGSKIAITGSHNFVHGGVLLGTREIALETKEPDVIAQLEKFIVTHVA